MPTLPQRLRSMARTTGLDGVAELLVEAAEAMERGAITAYEWDEFGCVHRSFSYKRRNGKYPDRTLTLYSAPQPPASQSREPLTHKQFGAIYAAWHEVGADVLGLQWNRFSESIVNRLKSEAAHGIKG